MSRPSLTLRGRWRAIVPGTRGGDDMTSSPSAPSLAVTLALLLAAGTAVQAQAPPSPPPPLVSPDVSGDGHVTFRVRVPGAKSVLVSLEGKADPVAMTRDQEGVWSATLGPLPADYYGYNFLVDGVTFADPSNAVTKPNFIWRSSEVHVPGPSLAWEVANVPHGRVHHHFHHSTV